MRNDEVIRDTPPVPEASGASCPNCHSTRVVTYEKGVLYGNKGVSCKDCNVYTEESPEASGRGEAPPERVWIFLDGEAWEVAGWAPKLVDSAAWKVPEHYSECILKSAHDAEVARLREALRTAAENNHSFHAINGNGDRIRLVECEVEACAAARAALNRKGEGE